MTRLNNFDRLRWIECLCDDDVRRVFGESQNVKSRQELDARNSSSRAPTLHEAITTKFNDESWTPYTNAYPSLHGDYVQQILLEKSRVEMTVERSKGIMADLKPCLTQMIHNYEASGEGAMGRDIKAPDWGNFDIAEANGIDDRQKFLLWPTKTCLLYMWARLDEYKLLSFTCSHLPKTHTADTDHAPDVSKLKERKGDDLRRSPTLLLTDKVGLVGTSMKRLANVEVMNQITRLEDIKMDLEFKLIELDDMFDRSKISICKI